MTRDGISPEDMTPSRWHRLETIYHHALELPADRRHAYLDQACDDDDAMRAELEALLAATDADPAASDSKDGPLDRALGSAIARSVADLVDTDGPRDSGPPARIGPYRVLRELGRGGLSTVYLAERDDDHYRSQVAIKLLRRGLDTDEMLARLRRERQILADLEHPNITRLLDGGATDDGQPYLVMERIDGATLDIDCDRRGLNIEQRVRLVLGVCDAVEVAHRRLVIHRDLKPSNVLVTADGTPKLLDFGIAKLLDRDSAGEPTSPALRLLTPEYASPEQLRGLPLTTATDIYSLGVMLYRLLTGHVPFPANQSAAERSAWLPRRPSEVVHDHASDGSSREEIAQSRATRPEGLARALRGDLDNILLKAMAPEPEERYGSVRELAEDLRRHLESRPVLARPASFALRFTKLIRRHRLATAAIILVTVSLVGGIAATTWQARVARQAQAEAERNLEQAERQQARAERQQARAERQQAQTEAVTNFLVGIFTAADPGEARGEDLLVRDVLDRGVEKIAESLDEEPEIRTILLHVIAQAYQSLGHLNLAAKLHGEALTQRRKHFPPGSLEIVRSLIHMGTIEFLRDNSTEAETYLRDALTLQREAQDRDPMALVEILSDLGATLMSQEKLDAAEPLLREALDITRDHLTEPSVNTTRILNNLGVLHYKQHEFSKAIEHFRHAAGILHILFDPAHPERLRNQTNLAEALYRQGDLEDSEILHRRTLTTLLEIYDEPHTDVASSLNNLAKVLMKLDQAAEAVTLYTKALAIFRATLGADATGRRISKTLANLGDALRKTGDLEGAKQHYRKALRINLEAGALHPETARVLQALAKLEEDPADAEPLLRKALEIRQQLPKAEDNPRTAEAELQLGICLHALGRHEEARERLKTARAGLLKQLDDADERIRQIDKLLHGFAPSPPVSTKLMPLRSQPEVMTPTAPPRRADGPGKPWA